jgi:hypothetical protein
MKTKNRIWLAIASIMIVTASTTLAQTKEFAGASTTGTDDLLVFFSSTQADDLQIVDVSAKTQQKVVGSVTTWQTPDGPFTVQHVAGVNPSGDLLVFFWSTQADSEENWQIVNVSDKTQQKVARSLISWQTPDGPFIVEHVAGVSTSGDLLVYFWSPAADWQVVNVSDKTQQKIAGPLTTWQVAESAFNVEHVAGASPSGDLVVYSWSPASDWQAVNVSDMTQQKIAGPITSWQTTSLLFKTEHVASSSPSGDLLVFFRTPLLEFLGGGGWQIVNVSDKTQQKIAGSLDSWVARGDEIVAVFPPDGHVSAFWSLAADHRDTRWGVCDMRFDIWVCTGHPQ